MKGVSFLKPNLITVLTIIVKMPQPIFAGGLPQYRIGM